MSDPYSFDEMPDANIDLTPLIDTVFMLLIFFIMATTFSQPLLEVALQEAKGSQVQEQKAELVTITITATGEIFCNDKSIKLEEIESFIIALTNDSNINFNVDKAAPFGLFVQILDVVKQHGKNKFSITTLPATQ